MKRGDRGRSVFEVVREYARLSHDPRTGYYELLTRLAAAGKASRALELGTFRGESARAILAGMPKDGLLVSIDVKKHPLPEAVSSDGRFIQIVGDSTFPGTYGGLGSGFDLAFVDTSHELAQAAREWSLVEGLLKPGAVVCFDDIHLNEGMACFWHRLPLRKWATGAGVHFSGFGVAVNEPEPQHLDRPSATRLAVCMVAHDDDLWIEPAVRSATAFGDVHVFVGAAPWSGEPGDTSELKEKAGRLGATVVEGDWVSEDDHRQSAHRYLRALGYTHALVADTDEVFEERLLATLRSVAESGIADRAYVEWDTYWHSPEFVVRPREPFTPCVMVDLFNSHHVHNRSFAGGRPLVLDATHGIVHHLSYAGPDERILRKVSSWSHRDEVPGSWWADKWLGWRRDRSLRDLHPTHPPSYSFVEHIAVPQALAEAGVGSVAQEGEREAPADWPTVAVCIPLYGGAEDIARCLESLESCRPLLHEVVVVDNGFPDGAKDEVRRRGWVRLVENEENEGFARASNRAYSLTDSDVVLFLNSDTVVTWHGLLAMVEDLRSSGTVAAVGPVSNRVGHFQQVPVTYTELANIHHFAQDLYESGGEPMEADMLVGFCLAVRCSALQEVGAFDEEFGLGLFEDNDLCHRLRRSGYRLLVSTRAFVHHEGSASLARADTDAGAMFERNRAYFERKWKRDLESGFVDSLPGLTGDRVRYDFDKKPETIGKRIAKDVARADVSLCMIVKNEERVIRDCLESAMPFFSQTVVVDTGSTDRTVEIARSMGAEVYVHPWEDSFSVARNHSLAHAKGQWVFWLDADDTLPIDTGLKVLHAALTAPRHVHGFVVPVQFVEENHGFGTRVDHVKLFRNFPGLQFEGRIHEQILGNLRKHGGEVARIDGVVLHSGYDTSEQGQARKRERDAKLLALDLQERPGHPFVLFNLGMTAHFTGHHEEAIKWLGQSIACAASGESHVRKSYALLAGSHRARGDEAAALAALTEGIEKVGEDPELRFMSGQSETALGNLEAALANYDKVFECDTEGHFSSFDTAILGHKTWHNSAGVLAELGRYSEARDRYLRAMAMAPALTDSAVLLFEQALAKSDFETALQCEEHVRQAEGASRTWCGMLRRRSEGAWGLPEAVRCLERAVFEFPDSAELRIELSRAHFDRGDVGGAMSVLAPLVQAGVAEAAYLLGVCCLAAGDARQAREHTAAAMRLNPGHVQTIEQLKRLNVSLGLDEDSDVVQ
ncbi:MAG: glycosyltransferase [Fimbriimonadaceae bacterium]|nr:glycosyltransferase [Fimbriimonadaceae bacterium]QYK59145.1 MAG: glycosyltransferase [Fimbriimonadaceae bacterium]